MTYNFLVHSNDISCRKNGRLGLDPVTCQTLLCRCLLGICILFSLLSCVWQWMCMYINHHIASLCRLVPLIVCGGGCVLFCLLYISRGWVLVVPYGFPVLGFHMGGLLVVLVFSLPYFHKACLLWCSFMLRLCMKFRTYVYWWVVSLYSCYIH